jgi:hypothetical protein
MSFFPNRKICIYFIAGTAEIIRIMLPSIKVLFESTSINLLPVKGIAIEI